MALDDVTSAWRLDDVTNTFILCETVQLLQSSYFFSAMAESWNKLKTSHVFSSFIVCLNLNRSAIVLEMLSNNWLYVGQLYEDKSLVVCARDLIFTADLQTVNYYSTIHY